MTQSQTWRARRTAFMHRYHARRAARATPATAFLSQPEPRTIGHFARGRQLIAGNYLFAGTLTEGKDTSLWDIDASRIMVRDELHGFGWLDDLAAVGDAKARACAQNWLNDWIVRYGNGSGAGWLPGLTGRRLIRWINHGLFVLRGEDKETSDAFFRSLAQQTLFLSRRWKATPPGLPRFEAITGIIYAGFALEGMRKHVAPARRALERDCIKEIDDDGGIASRNPEELLDIMTLLNWATMAIAESGEKPPQAVLDAIERIAPTLRALRHADGSLARFHGGGRGLDGRLDHALAASNVRTPPSDGLHMGYARLNAGRMSMVIDATPPPRGAASSDGHASTLALEITSGRRPIIVNCGSGRSFGDDWRRAGRATPSHSTLSIHGYSSSRLGGEEGGPELLVDLPTDVKCEASDLPDGKRLELSHNGFQPTHGLTHARILDVGVDGRSIVGEDLLTTLSGDDEQRFARALDATNLQGIPFSVRFHLHPDVDAKIDLGGSAMSLALKSGEIWVFRYDGIGKLELKPSVYLENGRLKPRGTQQVVLSGRAMAYATRVCWSLAKAQDTPDVVRDLAPR